MTKKERIEKLRIEYKPDYVNCGSPYDAGSDEGYQSGIIDGYSLGYDEAIDKACEFFEKYLFEIGYPDDWERDSENIISGEQRFRKAMKKELWKRWKE